MALGARTKVVRVVIEKKGSEDRVPLVSSTVSLASYNEGGKLWSRLDMEVQ